MVLVLTEHPGAETKKATRGLPGWLSPRYPSLSDYAGRALPGLVSLCCCSEAQSLGAELPPYQLRRVAAASKRRICPMRKNIEVDLILLVDA
jgi:hypothetical protein